MVQKRKRNLPALAPGAHPLYPQGSLDIAALWRLSFSRAGTFILPWFSGTCTQQKLNKISVGSTSKGVDLNHRLCIRTIICVFDSLQTGLCRLYKGSEHLKLNPQNFTWLVL